MKPNLAKYRLWIWVPLIVVVAVGAAALTASRWWPSLRAPFASGDQPCAQPADSHGGHEHDAGGHDEHGHDEHGHGEHPHGGHEHGEHEHDDHVGHEDATSLALSEQARRNIGLKVGQISLDSFQRRITVPGMVVERPGRTNVRITAPLNGVITDVMAASGEVVEPGDTLFVLRLTHEDLVQAQTEYLKNLEALDVENREIERLENMTQGVVAGKVILERKYEKQKIQGLLKAQREALLLHGLSEAQVDQIREQRRLLRELRVVVPDVHQEADQEHLQRYHNSPIGSSESEADPDSSMSRANQPTEPHDPLVLETLHVQNGGFVEAGAPLATLQNLETLYIEGRAFEQDANEIAAAARENLPVTALLEDAPDRRTPITGLHIVYLSNQVETASRALHFYVNLPNKVIRDTTTPSGQRFLTWRFKPGQRMRLRVPVETWSEQIVLPVEAVADDGVETYVFVENGDHFDRQPVHVRYRDQRYAVIANDGAVFPGDLVALNSAHQLQMAMKNKSGGGVDPHAGHNH